jgi:hypothetical protein
MLKEKNPLLKMKIKQEKSFLYVLIKSFNESLYSIYDLILEEPYENLWYECISIIFQYLQLIIYIFDKTVRLYILN